MVKRRRWTDKEIAYLEESVGRITVPTMAKRLGRTENAVILQMDRLGINHTKLETGMITMHELAKACGVSPMAVRGWINNGLKKVTRVSRSSAKYHFIDIDNFWEWAQENKDRIDFYKVDKHTLLPEPDWVEFQRKQDYHNLPRKMHSRWTRKEDNKMLQLLRTGMTKADIGKELNRSETSVKKRLFRIGGEKRNLA